MERNLQAIPAVPTPVTINLEKRPPPTPAPVTHEMASSPEMPSSDDTQGEERIITLEGPAQAGPPIVPTHALLPMFGQPSYVGVATAIRTIATKPTATIAQVGSSPLGG